MRAVRRNQLPTLRSVSGSGVRYCCSAPAFNWWHSTVAFKFPLGTTDLAPTEIVKHFLQVDVCAELTQSARCYLHLRRCPRSLERSTAPQARMLTAYPSLSISRSKANRELTVAHTQHSTQLGGSDNSGSCSLGIAWSLGFAEKLLICPRARPCCWSNQSAYSAHP